MVEKVYPDEEIRAITPEYFRVLKTPLLRGRSFTDADTADSPKVVIINEAMARKWFPNTDPIGKRITFSDVRKPDVEWVTIVGVVATIRHRGLEEEGKPEYYLPHTQSSYRAMVLAVRSKQDPRSLTSAIRTEIRRMDPDLPAAHVRTLGAGCVRFDRASSALGCADRSVRRGSAGTRSGRNLRCDVVSGCAAHARNRGADGAGCAAKRCAAPCDGARAAAGTSSARRSGLQLH